MDKKEIARRSDALYADGVRYHRRDLCDMIAYREADIKQLKEENVKLRELASGLHQCLDDEGCEGCPMQDSDGWCVRDIRLREMGIEVPE